MAPPLAEVSRVTWPEFDRALRWEQGEHVSLIGPTGCGKTELSLALLPRRTYVAALATKPRDDVLDRLVRSREWRRTETWSPRPNERRIVVWPRLRQVAEWRDAKPVYEAALAGIYRAGAWCVFLDEARVICDERRPFLGLAPHLRLLWTQGRSLGVSVIAATQRPAWVPPEMYDQATHLFFFRDQDQDNLRKISGLGGVDARTIRETVPGLGKHEVMYVNARTGRMARTTLVL